MKPDLHTHTTASDGLLTPAELVALADKHRVTLLAVTDHDTFDGAAQLLGKPAPMPILQGVELSLRDMPGLHLLGYGRGTDTPLHRKVRALSQMRLGAERATLSAGLRRNRPRSQGQRRSAAYRPRDGQPRLCGGHARGV